VDFHTFRGATFCAPAANAVSLFSSSSAASASSA